MEKIKKAGLLLIAILLMASCAKPSDDGKKISYYKRDDFKNVSKINEPWYENRVIAHAFGGIDGHDYTNSYEALVYNYNQGTRVFEIDLAYTSDNELVLLHEWSQYHEIFKLGINEGWSEESLDTFKNNLIYGNYHPMTFKELLTIMNEIEDFYTVLDSKTFDEESTKKVYQAIIDEIDAVNPKLKSRFIPQAYTPEIYDIIHDYNYFDDIIFTLYHYYVESDGYKIFNIAKERKIKNIVMHMNDDWAKRVIEDIRDYAMYDEEWNYENINIYIHTINDEEIAKKIVLEDNFYGIYSDFITEEAFKALIK